MASIFKRGRWVDASGHKCAAGTPGAKLQESRFWMVQVILDGRRKLVKGYTDKGASEQLGATLERAKARGEQGLVDPFKAHKARPLAEHVGDWIAELRQLGRDNQYVAPCKARMERLAKECGWGKLADINADSFCKWRETAMSTVGHAAKPGSNVVPMGPRTQNHYYETLRTFCRWCVKRERMPLNPAAVIEKVDETQDVRRARRALGEDDLAKLLGVVPELHQLAYRIILATGLRRDELHQLLWGDVRLDAPMPFIQLRADTTKAKRADVLPIRADLADLLRKARGEAGDNERVCRVPSIATHRRYLAAAGIAWEDEQGRRADFHALRHTYGTLLSKAGVAPRVAMALMRHTDIKLTMNCYTDPRIFDLAGAVEKLPAMGAVPQAAQATGTDGATGAAESQNNKSLPAGRSKSVSTQSALIGECKAVIGNPDGNGGRSLTLDCGGDRQQKSPIGNDGAKERVMGIEPTTFTLAT